MRDYGKVYTAFWTSEDTRAMSEDGRTLALYLLTCSHGNMLGCFRITDAYAADDLQWSIERVSKGFDELFQKGFAYRCNKTFWVVIQHYLKWNQFENPNVGMAAGKLFNTLSAPHTVKALLVNALRAYSPRFPSNKLDEFEALAIPFANPFGTLSKTVVGAVAVVGAVTVARTGANPIVDRRAVDRAEADTPLDTIFAYWQKMMNSPKSALDDKRRSLITQALKSYSPADICKAIRGCSKSPHNMGHNDRKTKYNGLNLILRDAEHIDYFINLDTSNAKPAVETVDQMNARVAAEFLADGQGGDENTLEMES
jgi:hypothetical protein